MPSSDNRIDHRDWALLGFAALAKAGAGSNKA
jgi:hypothetical protein